VVWRYYIPFLGVCQLLAPFVHPVNQKADRYLWSSCSPGLLNVIVWPPILQKMFLPLDIQYSFIVEIDIEAD
jgi:hypothetical protein